MTRKLLAALLTLMMIAGAIPFTALADVAPPTALGAPAHFGVSHYYGDSYYFAISAPEDMRAYIEARATDNPKDWQTFSPYFQIDYRIDGGSWHYTQAWDTSNRLRNTIYVTLGNGRYYQAAERQSLSSMFPEDESLKLFKEAGWDLLKSHPITFRARFVMSFDYDKTYVCSDWSKEFTLSPNTKADPDKLINHAPTLALADAAKGPSGEPYLKIKTGRLPGETEDLNAMTGLSIYTEVWMRRAGEQDFKLVNKEWFTHEYFEIRVGDYFDKTKQSYDEESYEIKIRSRCEMKNYKQSGRTDIIYSPFSNVISHNMPAWSKASMWATAELKKADDAGLIPDILKGADMTGPITREEFAELAVKLYEQTTGKASTPASPNPFKDTTNPQILKAFNLGITTGTSATTFAPKELTNREQVATMLSRAIRVMAPGADLSTAGAPAFSDQKVISSWALEHVLFMSRLGVIKGTDGKFMPKATTTAQTAAGYATTTREQAIAMSVRSYEQIESGALGTPTGGAAVQPSVTPSAGTTPTPSPTVTPTPTNASPAQQEQPAGSGSIAGTWQNGSMIGVTYNMFTGTFKYRSGIGQCYTFNSDGTFSSLIISGLGFAISINGKYAVKGDKITFTSQTGKSSSDGGQTWAAGNSPPNATYYYALGTDDNGSYLLMGLEGATPPLDIETNAVSYSFMQ